MLVVAGASLVVCSAAAAASHSTGSQFTLHVELDATKVDVGTQIAGTIILYNENDKSIPWTGCPQLSVAVGLAGRGIAFNPPNGLVACVSKYVFKPHGTVRIPISVETTYDGCGGPGVPKCPHDGIPLLPLGRYNVDVVNFGLPKMTVILRTPQVTLVNAITGQSTGPTGGSLLIQAYGCQTAAHLQPPIDVVVTNGNRVIARRSKLGVNQELIVGVSPGSYTIQTGVRPKYVVQVTNGVQRFSAIVPHCD